MIAIWRWVGQAIVCGLPGALLAAPSARLLPPALLSGAAPRAAAASYAASTQAGRGPAAAQGAALQKPEDCAQLHGHGRLAEARQCYVRLTSSNDPYVRAEGFWGAGRFQDANTAFRDAVKAQPKNAAYHVRWGRLYLDHYQPGDAVALFQEALEIKKDDAGALLGLALAAADGYESKAVEFAQQALKADPKLVEAQELLARLALEESDRERAIREADKALAMSPEALGAMAVRASIDWLADKPSTPWIDRILKINPAGGDAYATAGHFFMINRRYEEAIAAYRKAIELDPELWSARTELGVNLMRLGQEAEARQQLEACYQAEYRNAAVVNTLTLIDSYKNFVTFKTPATVVRLHRKEADVLRLYIEPELERAMSAYEKKYKLRLDRPVQVEAYPDHADFAVRTLGLPELGALGVTFGTMVAMDSPSARPPGSFHWASTLWHELSHVYVLTATKHHVPRWFTEGVAVHEETAVSPEWGDRLSPDVIAALKGKKLLPVAELDRGFVRPAYPAQVVVSYFQAGKICDFITGKWGWQKILDMMYAFAAGKTTPEVIEAQLGMKPEAFDREFMAWLEPQTSATVAGFEEWRKRLKGVAQAAKAGRHDDVIREGTAIRDMYPDYVEAGSVYEFLGEAYEAKGDKAKAVAELERYAKQGGRDPVTLKHLARLQEEAGRRKDAIATLERLNYIYPVQDDELHRRLGDLMVAENQPAGAIREYSAVVASKPVDTAASHFNLARAYRMANQKEAAKEQLLLALEAAPGYRPAQKMLLELSQ